MKKKLNWAEAQVLGTIILVAMDVAILCVAFLRMKSVHFWYPVICMTAMVVLGLLWCKKKDFRWVLGSSMLAAVAVVSGSTSLTWLRDTKGLWTPIFEKFALKMDLPTVAGMDVRGMAATGFMFVSMLAIMCLVVIAPVSRVKKCMKRNQRLFREQ